MESGIIEQSENDTMDITIPTARFKDFFEKLLGSQRTDEWMFNGVVRIEKATIRTFIEKVNQKIKAQYVGAITSVDLTVQYDQEYSRAFENVDEFLAYDEEVGKTAEEIRINFVFLLLFPDEDFPQKQNLSVTFSSSDNSSLEAPLGFTLAKIFSTNLMWANDFSKFIRDEIKQYVSPYSFSPYTRVMNFFRNSRMVVAVIGLAVAIGGLSSSLSEIVNDTDSLSLRVLEREIENLQQPAVFSEAEKLVINFEGEIGSEEWKEIIDDSQRLEYYKNVELKKAREETRPEMLASYQEMLEETQQSKKENIFLKSLKLIFMEVIAMKAVWGSLSIVSLIVFLLRLQHLKYKKSNVSIIWLNKPNTDFDKMKLEDFEESVAIALGVGVIVSLLMLLVSSYA